MSHKIVRQQTIPESQKIGISKAGVITPEDITIFKEQVEPRLYEVAILVGDGMGEMEIATRLGIPVRQYRHFLDNISELQVAINEGRKAFLESTEKTLYHMAKGIHYEESEEKTVYVPIEGADESDMKIREKVLSEKKKYVPPQQKAIEFILTNQKASDWKKNVPVNLEQNNLTVNLDASPEALDAMANRIRSLFVDTAPSASDDQDEDAEDAEEVEEE